jgi:hypothetical protein
MTRGIKRRIGSMFFTNFPSHLRNSGIARLPVMQRRFAKAQAKNQLQVMKFVCHYPKSPLIAG